MGINSEVVDGFANLRDAMLSYYEDTTVQQLKPAPTRVELGIYDELEGEVNEAAETFESVKADGREEEEVKREQQAKVEAQVKPPTKVKRQRGETHA